MVVGRILEVSDHPGSRGPSYLVHVDFGDHAGEAQMEPGEYEKDELVGALVVVTDGIVLMARSHAGPRLVRPDGDVEPGTLVA